ncbi:MAG TPA: Crp/Fnr family transcriptional regulator [Cyclobacteriaceae bacterium]|jgi:CRP-like cAMP-binding protein|nr:Crp/Fnr family transcriptional regulator [Cyclobacteriaceae bacterium]
MTSDAFVQYLRLFDSFTDDETSLIRERFPAKKFYEGEQLCKIGEVCHTMNFICNGVLRIYSLNEKGIENTHFFLKENQFCCVLDSFTTQMPSTSAIEAACDTDAIVLHRQAMEMVYNEIPHLKTTINQIIQRSLIEKIALRNLYLGEDATTRYTNFLIRQPEIAMRVSLGDIASYLGVTQQSLSRIRKSMV